MKYQVTYVKPKKKGFSKQTVVFYNVEDAYRWETYIKDQGCESIQVLPKFN